MKKIPPYTGIIVGIIVVVLNFVLVGTGVLSEDTRIPFIVIGLVLALAGIAGVVKNKKDSK